MTQGPTAVGKEFTLPPLPKPLRQARKELDKAAKVGKAISATGKLAEFFTIISKEMLSSLKGTRGASILATPFFVYDCVNDVVKFFIKPKIIDKVKAAFSFVINSETVTSSIAASCEILNTMKLVGERATNWIPIFNIVSFVVSFLTLGVASKSLLKSKELFHLLNETEKKLRSTGSDTEKAVLLIDVLREIETTGITEIRKQLLISKKTNLEERIHKLIQRLQEGSKEEVARAVEESEKVLSTLHDRAMTDLSLNLITVANKIMFLVGAGFMFIPPLVPFGIFLLAVSATTSLILCLGKTYFISKDPFSGNASCKAYQFYESLSKALKNMRMSLETFVIGQKKIKIKTSA